MSQLTDTYKTVASWSEGVFKDKGSKFIAYLYPVKSEEQIKEILKAIKAEHYSARHHCYAYRLGWEKKVFRSSDDGEPSGTAGKPILGQIVSADLTDVLIVVVRYFGGILLGSSGLINAYRLAAENAIFNASVEDRIVYERYITEISAEHINELLRLLKDFDARIIAQNFTEHFIYTYDVRLSKALALTNKILSNHHILSHEKAT